MESNRITQIDAHPRKSANPVSILSFSWLIPFFWKGWKKDLELEDLYKPLEEHTSKVLGDMLESLWEEEITLCKVKNKNPKLLRVILKMFGGTIFLQGVIVFFVEFIFRLAQPILLGGLIDSFIRKNTINSIETQLYAAGLIVCTFLTALFMHTYHMNVVHIGMKIRVATSSLIYRKTMKLSSTRDDGDDITTGKIVNLLANDAMRFDYAITFLHDLWIGPLHIVVIYCLLWFLLGYSAFVGLIPVIIFVFLHFCFGKTISNLRRKTVLKTDDRINYTNEVIKGIHVVKMNAWEKSAADFVSNLREKEMNIFKKLSYIRGIMNSFPMFHTRLTTAITILTYVLLGNYISSKKVFELTSFLNILQTTVATYFPEGISQMSEFFVSVKRIEEYLISNENYDSTKNSLCKPEVMELNMEYLFYNLLPHLKMDNVCAKWSINRSDHVLNDFTLNALPGKVNVITGEVGCGKTAVLKTILGEMVITKGSIDIEDTISYSSQEPWLFPGSIRQNILFGNVYETEKYKNILNACALDVDIDNFQYGDMTNVGGKGASLSTGQKARINLARSIYKDVDIYLFDDPLSSVDLNVGRYLYRNCIKGLLKDKIVILVSHQLQYFDDDDNIILLKQGEIKFQGSKINLDNSYLGYMPTLSNQNDFKNDTGTDSIRKRRKTSGQGNISSMERRTNNDHKNKNNMKLYQSYLKAGYGKCILMFTVIMFIMPQLFGSFGDFWLSFWVNLEENNSYNNQTIQPMNLIHLLPTPTRTITIAIFGGLVAATIVTSFIRSIIYYCACMKASINLHGKMFTSITRAPMLFFNTTNAGSILTRFSKDLSIIDEQLPTALHDFLQITLIAVGILCVVPTTNPWLLLPTVLAFVLFFLLRTIYISTSNSLRTLEGSTRSPIITHLTSTLQGLVTIRSSKAQDMLINEFDNHQDNHSSTWYIYLAISRAFALWLDIICVLYNAAITLLFVFADKNATGASVGLAITQANGLTGILQWGVRQSAEVDNNMVSVKRILDYTKLEQESSLHSTGIKVMEGWPQRGALEFINVSMRYDSQGPKVLNNISFSVLPGQKVGIVGRTGSGKTSLIAALFRLANIEGTIKLDGVDISMLGLHDFRSKITIIPQEPFLFSGSLRKCLDPFDEHTDDVLWKALDEVNLKEFVKDFNCGLNLRIIEGGTNISVGQRQLICLARAIINENKIIVLDESTANIDFKTDSLIQNTINTRFSSSTVLTIAHRILTVMNSNLMIVMDSGNIVEMGHPFNLLQNEEGFLQTLIDGSETFREEMFNIAKQSYEDCLAPIHDCTS